jgi:CPA1 family monovalent cation:H+ antiporter
VVRPLREQHLDRLRRIQHRSDGDDGHRKLIECLDEIEFTLIAAERDLINDLYRRGKLKDEARRRIERDLDLRDARLTNLRSDE